jgi:hypothetical protein
MVKRFIPNRGQLVLIAFGTRQTVSQSLTFRIERWSLISPTEPLRREIDVSLDAIHYTPRGGVAEHWAVYTNSNYA